MEKLLVQTRAALSQSGDSLQLRYYLTAEPDGNLERYGTEVVMTRGGGVESYGCRDVTPVASRMLQLIDALADNTVTPALLREILTDLL